MTRSLQIEYAQAYELVLSLQAFAGRARWKSLDLGPAWGADAAKRLGPENTARLQRIKDVHLFHLLLPLVHQCPGARDADSFIPWLASLTPGDLYERLLTHCDEEDRTNLPVDLGAWRDEMLPALRTWNAAYFSQMDPAIHSHLKADAAARQAQATVTPALALVEEVTNGLHLTENDQEQILLVPQYHHSPWNVTLIFQRLRVIMYPVEPLQGNPNQPPMALSRLIRALSDENRVRILRFLAREPLNLNELTDRTGLAKSTVHHHMVALRAARLVVIHEERHEGRYSLRPGWLDLITSQLRSFIVSE